MNFSQKQAALADSQQCHQAQGDQEVLGNSILDFSIALALRHADTQTRMQTQIDTGYTDKCSQQQLHKHNMLTLICSFDKFVY